MTTTCQICGREIKASTGKIAHHGYRRPAPYYQTASCFGARHLPYEVSRDALPLAIDYGKATLVRVEEARRKMLAEPPITLTVGEGTMLKKAVPKPEGFSAKERPVTWRPWTYEAAFWSIINEQGRTITAIKNDIKFWQHRYDTWVQPQ